MEESASTSQTASPDSSGNSRLSSSQVISWQKKLLPWLIIMPTLLILIFIVLATRQMERFNAVIDSKSESVIEKTLPLPSDSALDLRLKGNMDYIRWVTLARLEEISFDRRYKQGGLLLASRIFTKYLGFFTGMILAIVGAVFIIGKLQENSSDIGIKAGKQLKFNIVSSSPGIIFGTLGTILMLSTILQHTDIELRDQPLFLNAYNIQINSIPKTPQTTTTSNSKNSRQKSSGDGSIPDSLWNVHPK